MTGTYFYSIFAIKKLSHHSLYLAKCTHPITVITISFNIRYWFVNISNNQRMCDVVRFTHIISLWVYHVVTENKNYRVIADYRNSRKKVYVYAFYKYCIAIFHLQPNFNIPAINNSNKLCTEGIPRWDKKIIFYLLSLISHALN